MSHRRKTQVLCLFLLLCLLPLTGLAHQRGFGEFAMDDVNVRKTPGGDILFKKQRGEEVFIRSWQERGGHTWLEVNTYNADRVTPVDAWVRADMVVPPEILFTNVKQVAANHNMLIALKSDGTAVFGGQQHKHPELLQGAHPDTWRDVIQVAAGFYTVYGLKQDGSVYKWGMRGPENGIQGVMGADGALVPFQAIDAVDDSLLALMADGQLMALMGNNQRKQVLPAGSGVQAFAAGYGYYDDVLYIQGGRVHSTWTFHEGAFAQSDRDTLHSWQDIVLVEAGMLASEWQSGTGISQGEPIVAGIRGDGAVVALSPKMNEDVRGWTDIADIQAGNGFLVGLTAQGMALAAGQNKQLVRDDIAGWSGIVDIACGRTFCVGVTQDGTLLFAGDVQLTHH